MHTLVGRIIVHISHHKHLHLWIQAKQGIFHSLGLTGATLAIEGIGETTWPVTNDDSHIIPRHLTSHRKETTGIKGRILCQLLHIRNQLHILHRKKSRIIKQRTVDASLIRTFDMAELHIASLQRRLGSKVSQHIDILHLGKTDEGTTCIRQHIRTHISQGTRHILQLTRIFLAIPSLSRQILIIILAGIMTGIKEVLLVVEANGIDLELFRVEILLRLLRPSTQANHEQGCQ